MYIKINKRFSSGRGYYNRGRGYYNLQFSVIESYREGGKVKHRTLSYLATISEGDFENVSRLESFWGNCEKKLENFSESDRTHLTARLEAIVPRPTEEMRQENERVRRETMAFFSRLPGFNPSRSTLM
jgi:hypothetical protein